MEAQIIDTFTKLGVAGVIGSIWYITHKSYQKNLETVFEQAKEREKVSSDNFKAVLEQQDLRTTETMNRLKELIDVTLLQTEKIDQLRNSTETNKWCPIWRKIVANPERYINDEQFNLKS